MLGGLHDEAEDREEQELPDPRPTVRARVEKPEAEGVGSTVRFVYYWGCRLFSRRATLR